VPHTIHRVRDWGTVRTGPGLRLHQVDQALLVAASSFAQPRPACGIVAAAIQQQVTSAQRVTDVLSGAARQRHRSALRAALGDILQGSQALSEIDFVRLCRRYRLPTPIQQLMRREPSGRRRYLDATWRRADGRLVVAEVDGALHLSQRRWWDDQLRQNELMLADAIVLRFPSVIVRTEPTVVAEQLRRALRL